MRNQLIIILLAIGLIAVSCKSGSESANLTITGNVKNAENEMMYLNKYSDSLHTYYAVDSVKVSNNQYQFETHIDSMEFIVINSNKDLPIELIAKSGEEITIDYDFNDVPASVEIKGSEHSQANIEMYKYIGEFEKVKEGFKSRIQDITLEDTIGRQNILAEFEVERSKFQIGKAELFSQHETSPATHVFLPYLNPENELKYFQQIERNFSTHLKNTVWHTATKKKLEEVESYILQIEQYKKQQAALKKLAPGEIAPEISLADPKGNIRNLSDLRGKVVLIDFWASWCRPCRMENPNVVKLYNKYKSKGFEIFSVSLDQDASKWEMAIQQDGLIWENHVSDLLGWNTSVTSLYGFSGIPYTVLIDREGKIIASKLRGPELEKALNEIF